MTKDELQRMSLREKLFAMETLWEELSRNEEQIETPQWHKDLLEHRESLIRQGKARFTEWEVAKREIDEATQQ